jgi:hypothetical protein
MYFVVVSRNLAPEAERQNWVPARRWKYSRAGWGWSPGSSRARPVLQATPSLPPTFR